MNKIIKILLQDTGIPTLFIGQQIISLKTVDSTNTYAKELLANFKPVPEGTAIMAEDQRQGRGQAGSSWYSEPGMNLTFSLALYPVFLAPDRQFLLSKVISLALADFLQSETNADIKIKWPNDIFINGLKSAGILIENTLRKNLISHSIVGIGININQTDFGMLPAVSLKSLTGLTYDLKHCFSKLCGRIEARYLQLRAGNTSKLDAEYLERLYQYRELHTYKTASGFLRGEICGVSPEGRLQLWIRPDEIPHEFNFKEIAFI